MQIYSLSVILFSRIFYPHLALVFFLCFPYLHIYRRTVFSNQEFRPLDEADIFRIVEYLLASDIHEIIVRLESIEIEMIDILPVFIIVHVGRTLHGCFDSKQERYEMFGNSRLPSPEIPTEKDPISLFRGDR